ncbi:MAG: citrate/2-methylcitrate synthase [Isosphaeraceae bacterium]
MTTPVGSTAISELGPGDRLTYRGYAIEDLAGKCGYEEVAYLLLRGRLPDSAELAGYRSRLMGLRTIPGPLLDLLDRIPDGGGPLALMDALRTACSFLGSLEPERSFDRRLDAADRLIALLPGLMVTWHRRIAEGERIEPISDEPSTAGHILRLLFDRPPAEVDRRALDASLVLYADLAFNASTFACRVCAATLSDYHSCITTGIGTLRGPLHGGASSFVLGLLDAYATPEEAEAGIRERLAKKERLMGFGHAVFRHRDPRTAILHGLARELAVARGEERRLAVAEAIERAVLDAKGIFANVDFYTACCYRSMGIPLPLFGPLFVCARAAGWSAHVGEQRERNKLIHPVAEYTGPPPRPLPR